MKNTKIPSFHCARLRALHATAALCLAALVSTAQAESWLFDFGAAGTTTVGVDDPANTWNNVTEAVATTNTGSLLNLVTTSNVVTDVDLLMVSRFNAANTNGTVASTRYVPDATRDSFYGNTAAFGGLSNVTPIFKFTSLDPALTYNFSFYASRMDAAATDTRETQYTVSGSVSGSAVLNVLNNINGVAQVSGITPTLGGEITISLAPTAANNHPNDFIYLGVLGMESVPEPATGLTLGAGALFLATRRRRLS